MSGQPKTRSRAPRLLIAGSLLCLVASLVIGVLAGATLWNSAILPATRPLAVFPANEPFEFSPPDSESGYMIALNTSSRPVEFELPGPGGASATMSFVSTSVDPDDVDVTVTGPNGAELYTEERGWIRIGDLSLESVAVFQDPGSGPVTIEANAPEDTELAVLRNLPDLLATKGPPLIPAGIASVALLIAFVWLLIAGLVALSSRPSRIEREIGGA